MVGVEYDADGFAVIWSERDREFVGLARDFPSVSWLAPTREEALAGVRAVLADLL